MCDKYISNNIMDYNIKSVLKYNFKHNKQIVYLLFISYFLFNGIYLRLYPDTNGIILFSVTFIFVYFILVSEYKNKKNKYNKNKIKNKELLNLYEWYKSLKLYNIIIYNKYNDLLFTFLMNYKQYTNDKYLSYQQLTIMIDIKKSIINNLASFYHSVPPDLSISNIWDYNINQFNIILESYINKLSIIYQSNIDISTTNPPLSTVSDHYPQPNDTTDSSYMPNYNII